MEMRSALISAAMSYWAVARVHNETLAGICLAERGYEVFAPKIETRRRTLNLLFPSHVFILIISQWTAANYAPGVLKLIRFGEHPAKVPEAEIEALKARADDKGVIHLPPPPPPPSRRVYAKGEKVRVIAFGATFNCIHSGMTKRDREIVLANVMGSMREIAVARHSVSAAE
jgi:Transcription termination factor nusG